MILSEVLGEIRILVLNDYLSDTIDVLLIYAPAAFNFLVGRKRGTGIFNPFFFICQYPLPGTGISSLLQIFPKPRSDSPYPCASLDTGSDQTNLYSSSRFKKIVSLSIVLSPPESLMLQRCIFTHFEWLSWQQVSETLYFNRTKACLSSNKLRSIDA